MTSEIERRQSMTDIMIDLATMKEGFRQMEKRMNGMDSKFWWMITFQMGTLVGVIIMLMRHA